MALVQVADVQAIMEIPDEIQDSTIQAFIDDCDILVQELLVSPTPPIRPPNPALSTARLTAIEKYLTAHAILQYSERGGLASSRLADAGDTYPNMITRANQDRNGLQLTRYGQLALTFDTSGILLKFSLQRLPAKFKTMKPRWGTGGHINVPDPWIWLFV